MADEVTEEEQEKKGGKKKIIMIVGLLVVAGVGYKFMAGGSAVEEEEVVVDAAPVEGVVIDGATMTVALSGEVPHYVRVSFAIVLAEGADSAVVGNRVQILQDAALTVISGYTADQLMTSEGLDQLREDLSAKSQDVYPDGEVIRIVLTEVLVQ